MAERERNLCAGALNALAEAYRGYREVREAWNVIAINLRLDPTMWSSDLYRNLASGEVRFEKASLCRNTYCIPLRDFVETHIKYETQRKNLDIAVKESRETCEPVKVGEITVE